MHPRAQHDGTQLGGWLLVLSLLLLVAHPVSLALTASTSLRALPTRGAPLGILMLVRFMVAGVGIAAGLALLNRRPGAVTLAKSALILSAGAQLITLMTPYVPTNRMPGDTALYVCASLAYHFGWLAYLVVSRRVRSTFS